MVDARIDTHSEQPGSKLSSLELSAFPPTPELQFNLCFIITEFADLECFSYLRDASRT
jgi:hypothetical protein